MKENWDPGLHPNHLTNKDWDLTPTASWGSAWTNTWFEHSSASPATTVLDQPDESQEPELSWETSMANSQGYWVGDQGTDLPPILPDNQLGDPTIFGVDGEPIVSAALDDGADVLVATAGDENPIHVGNVPWSGGQWPLTLALLMDGLDWSQHYAVGGGFILDFVGPTSLNHTPAKCQFPLEIYRVNRPYDWDDQNHEEPPSTWEDWMDWGDEWEGQKHDTDEWDGQNHEEPLEDWMDPTDEWEGQKHDDKDTDEWDGQNHEEPPSTWEGWTTSDWDDWIETPAISGWEDYGVEGPVYSSETSGGWDDWAGWDGGHGDPTTDEFISNLEKELESEIEEPYSGYSALKALFLCFYCY